VILAADILVLFALEPRAAVDRPCKELARFIFGKFKTFQRDGPFGRPRIYSCGSMDMRPDLDQTDRLVTIARVLACRTRMNLLAAVGPTGCAVTEAARRVGISQPTATYHLARMAEVGLVRRTRRGREHIYRWGRERWFLAAQVVD